MANNKYTTRFASLEEFTKHTANQFEMVQTELKEIKIAILNLKHQDKLSFNIKEAAIATGYGADTLYSYVKQGIIPVAQTKRGARIVITKEDLIDFLMSKKK